jgi:RNA polymerase sigma-70 factor (ECF subfamily)
MPLVETAAREHDMERQELLRRLRRTLVALRPEEREVFLLRQNGELAYAQISARCGRPVDAVKAQMRSALRKLGRSLTDSPSP